MTQRSIIPTADLLQVARGFLMGGADIIPGVSGGTVALILGIYSRLVTAITRFDATLIRLLIQRQWQAAVVHVDLRFLVALGTGILLGIGGLATLMHHLLENHLQVTFAAFFGMILASCWLVGRAVPHWRATEVVAAALAAIFAYWLVGLPLLQQPPDGNGYTFLCGVLGICAMILPGISGSFILLILGKYSDITGLLKDVLHGHVSVAALTTIAVFVVGCAVGLLGFSRVLKWLLSRFEPTTMAALCGFMAGSLRKIWPFKLDLTPDLTEFKHKLYENVAPNFGRLESWYCLAAIVIAGGLVLLLDRMTLAEEQIEHLPDTLEAE